MRSTGLVLAAGGIAAANEILFAPLASSTTVPGGPVAGAAEIAATFNWRIIPATAILALTLGGFEKIAPEFAVGLAGLSLLAVLIVPVGKAPTPIDNITKALGY
jgi:hypothetical protein